MSSPVLSPLAFAQLDAFTGSHFGGNPAVVVQFPAADDPRLQDPGLLVNVAREFAQPMTAFLSPLEHGACTISYAHAAGVSPLPAI